MKWPRGIAGVAVLLVLAVVAAWQWREYGHECDQARETVASAADSVMNALVGGVRSHRRLGQFFAEQMQGVLEGLVRSRDVLAVALVSADGQHVFSAGQSALLPVAPPFTLGPCWDRAGFRLVTQFRLPLEGASPGGERGGYGGGRGWGRRLPPNGDAPEAFAPGETATAVLLVDRGRADRAIQRARSSRGLLVVVSWALVGCVALIWRASVRLAEARGRARTLEVETRHWRDLSQAAAGLAHETRNPLGLIRGWTQRLADECPGGQATRQRAQAVIEECDRITARINQFLAFARPSEPQLRLFDPADVVAELAVLLEPDLCAKGLALRRPTSGHAILADRELFRQALFNLLQNAIEASPERAVVETSLARDKNGRLQLDVADRGPGVPADQVHRLFTPYFTTRDKGNGLGLAIVRRIAAAHGWDVQYLPRPGGGAIFRMTGMHD